MRRLLILGLLAAPLNAAAQTTEDGLGLVERGLGMIAENLWNRLGPQLDQFGRDLGPVLQDLAVLVDDLGNYQAPERLANGDILIRRKAGAPPPPPIGDRLRDPGESPALPTVPIDPDQPQIPL